MPHIKFDNTTQHARISGRRTRSGALGPPTRSAALCSRPAAPPPRGKGSFGCSCRSGNARRAVSSAPPNDRLLRSARCGRRRSCHCRVEPPARLQHWTRRRSSQLAAAEREAERLSFSTAPRPPPHSPIRSALMRSERFATFCRAVSTTLVFWRCFEAAGAMRSMFCTISFLARSLARSFAGFMRFL